MRFGIPAFLFLAVGYVIVLLRVGLRRFDDDKVLWNLRRAWMFSFLGLTFTLTTVHVWGSVYSFVFFIFGAGMWMMTTELEQQGTRTEDSPESGARTPQGHTFTRTPIKQSRANTSAKNQRPLPVERDPSEGSQVYTRFPTQKR